MSNHNLDYQDSEKVIIGSIVRHNDTDCLYFHLTRLDNGKVREHYLPVEFLANFDRYMFGAVFKL